MPTGWYVAQPPSSGVATSATKPPTANMTGQQPEWGPLATALKPATVAAFGQIGPAGPITVATAKPVMTALGSQDVPGTMGASTKPPTATLTQNAIQGSMGLQIAKVVAAITGEFPINGQASMTAQKATAILLGSETLYYQGAFAAQLAKSLATLAGQQAQAGSMAAATKPAKGLEPGRYEFATPGTYTFTTPQGSGYHIDRIALGPGNGGRNYGFGVSANGGRSGIFAWDTITEGVDFTAGDTITIVVAAGGAGNTPASAPTTITVGTNTLTGPNNTDTSYVSGYTGQPVNTGNVDSNKNLVYNNELYVGGSGGTGTSSNDPAGPPIAPGGGGWGSNSNGVAGRPGGNGRAWINIRP